MVKRGEIQSRVADIKAAMADREERLRGLEGELSALRSRFEGLAAMQSWAEIELGAWIAEGTTARYLTKVYRCVESHAKSLTRRPTEAAYWEEIAI